MDCTKLLGLHVDSWRVLKFVLTLAETNMGTLRAMAERNMRKEAKRAVLGPNWGRSGCMIRR